MKIGFILKSTLTVQKNCVICFLESPLKMMKNTFYFIVKAFRTQDIYVFVMTFWSCTKNGLIRKIG